jgi:hypothetical protein
VHLARDFTQYTQGFLSPTSLYELTRVSFEWVTSACLPHLRKGEMVTLSVLREMEPSDDFLVGELGKGTEYKYP